MEWFTCSMKNTILEADRLPDCTKKNHQLGVPFSGTRTFNHAPTMVAVESWLSHQPRADQALTFIQFEGETSSDGTF